MEEYRSLGKLVATFGVQGELVLKHSLGKKSALKGLKVLFIEFNEAEMIPYFIEEIRIRHDDELFVKLEGIDSKEQAKPLTQKMTWLPADVFSTYAAKTAPISVLGYRMMFNERDLGEILEVIEQPHQLLCRIDLNGKEALIPIHEESLQKIDRKKKIMYVELPDGLLEIYE